MAQHEASQNEHEAALWVVRMDADDWSEDQEADLQAWLAAEPRRAGALLQAQAAWMTLDKPEASHAALDEPAPSLRFNRRHLMIGGGAAIAASIAGGLFLLGGGTHYSTGVGEIRRVPLADGSTAAINTASTIEINLANVRREVRIAQGEAWFQVAKDPKRPFVVEAGRVRVQAVGTAFSVRRRDDGADILVTEGVVEAWVDGAEGHKIRLAAGSRAFVANNAAIRQEPAAPSSVDRALAWRSGKIDLVGEPLAGAIAEFNRYNHRKLVLVDPALGGEQFDGVFRTDDPEGFALAVKSISDVPVDLSSPDEIRIGRPRN